MAVEGLVSALPGRVRSLMLALVFDVELLEWFFSIPLGSSAGLEGL